MQRRDGGGAKQDSQCQLRVRKLSWQTQENLGRLRIYVLPTCSASPGIATHVGHVVWVLLAMFRVAHVFITVSFDCYLRRKSWSMVTVLWLLGRAGSWGVRTLSSWQAGSGERSRGRALPALALARRMLWDLMQNRGSMGTGTVLTISQWAKRPSSSPIQPSHHICFNPFSKVWAMSFYLKNIQNKNQKIHIIISCNRFRFHIPTYTKHCLLIRRTETLSYCGVSLINLYFQTIFMILGIQIK